MRAGRPREKLKYLMPLMLPQQLQEGTICTALTFIMFLLASDIASKIGYRSRKQHEPRTMDPPSSESIRQEYLFAKIILQATTKNSQGIYTFILRPVRAPLPIIQTRIGFETVVTMSNN